MKNLILPTIALFFIITLCSQIDTYSQNFLFSKPSAELNDQIFYKTFGEFREYLSNLSYLQADAYFHGQGQRCKEEIGTENHIETQEEHEAEHTPSVKSSNPLLNIGRAMGINQHRHLSRNEQKEMLPWFYFAIKLNPHNESAYTIGGFWLATHLKKIDEAIKFLKQGLNNNPDSWKIYSQLGEIYILQKKDYTNAAYYFEQAKKLADQQEAGRFEKKVIYVFLAEAYRKLGKAEQAKILDKEIDSLFSTEY